MDKATVAKLFLIFMFSSLAALLVASYTETHQSPFFSAVKNLVLHGSGSRYVESEDVLHTRYDWLGQYLFSSITEVQEHATRWLWTYNNERPNMAIGGITPVQKLQKAA